MKKRKYIDLVEFQYWFDQFLFIPSYTKEKHILKNQFYNFLNRHLSTTISVKPNTKYNNCLGTHSFTILKVPQDRLGKLFKYRGKWVLIRCDSMSVGSWGYYWNDIYELKHPIDQTVYLSLKSKYNKFFILTANQSK